MSLDLEDVDEIAVERVLMRDRPYPISRGERIVAVARLTRYGYSAAAIAEMTWTTKRQVCRDRAEARAAELLP